MADRTARSFLCVLKDALVALGVDIAFKEWMKRWGTFGALKFRHEVLNLEEDRANLLQDIMVLDKQGKVCNVMRRHREAIAELMENRFVALLCKIPKEERRATIAWLDTLTDQEFDQALALLDHDVVMQWIGRMRGRMGRITKKDLRALAGVFQRAGHTIDATASAAAPTINSAAAWLEQRQAKRHAGIRRKA